MNESEPREPRSPSLCMDYEEDWIGIVAVTDCPRRVRAHAVGVAEEILKLPRNPDRTAALRALRECLLWARQSEMVVTR